MIEVFDNKVPYDNRAYFYGCCLESNIRLGWHDRQEPGKYELNLHSYWSKDDYESSFISSFIDECINTTEWFTTKNFLYAYLNVVTSDSVHYVHSHRDMNVALYYVNLDWEDGWYGETIFYNENNLNEIVFTTPFVPGRIVLFKGSVPHAIRPPSVIAPRYRLTLSCFFN